MRRASVRDDSGFTLVETLVAMVILGGALAVMYAALSSLQTTAAGTQERLGNLDEARLLMATVTKDLRTATVLPSETQTPDHSPFVDARDDEVTFYANIDSTTGPYKVHIFVDAQDRLVEEVTEPVGIAPNYTYTSTPTTRVVGSYVANGVSGTGPMFTYLDSFNTPLVTPLSTEDRAAAAAVEVVISIRKSTTQPTRATTLENRVRLPNVYYDSQTEGT